MRNYLIALGIFAILVGTIYGSSQIFRAYFLNALEEKAAAELSVGNYLASLLHYTELKNNLSKKDEQDTQSNIERVTDLLVAEEIYTKAQRAAENGEWFEVKALLQQSDDTTNTSFKDYKDAIDLYVEAANKVKDLEKKIAGMQAMRY